MIELYEGRLGGGKTYSACVRMVDQVARGGLIATNIEIIWDKFSEYIENKFNVVPERDQFISLQDEQIGLFHRFTPSGTAELPVLVVIDEAHLTFNARDFAQTDKLYRETLTFLTQSRKVNTDIIFIAQSVLNMDKQFMRLVQFIWRFRDLAKWKIPGLGIPYPLKQILAVQFDYDGKTVLQRSFIQKDKRIFGLYNTNSLIREFPRLTVTKTKRQLLKSKSNKEQMKLLIPLGIVLGVISAFFLYKKISNIGKPTTPVGATALAKPTPEGNVNTTGSTTTKTTTTAKTEKERNEGAYDIYDEEFKSWNGNNRELATKEGGWYQVGEMSSRGYVTAVSDRRARVAQPDGRTGWVVANSREKSSSAPIASPTASPSPPIIAASPSPSTPVSGTPTASPINIVVPAGTARTIIQVPPRPTATPKQ
jgi:zona occludens toxin (predicted ATPase)